MKKLYIPNLRVGDSVGGLYKTGTGEDEKWELVEDKITKITQTKKDGWKYYVKNKFVPLYAEEVDDNTKDMESAIGKGYIITREVFGLNEKTRPFAERWVEWANKNMNKAVSVLEDVDDDVVR